MPREYLNNNIPHKVPIQKCMGKIAIRLKEPEECEIARLELKLYTYQSEIIWVSAQAWGD